MSLRIVQWTTGNVGTQTALAILNNPELELIGCYAWSQDKVGRDIGELLGIEAVGVQCSSDRDALIALQPDCICYNPLWGEVDDLVAFLSAGINVVTSTHFITGSRVYGAEGVARLEAACAKGQASLFGSGMHPGFSNMLALAATTACNRVDRISILESQDASGYASAETQRSVGFDHPINADYLPDLARDGSQVFAEGLELMADSLGVVLDNISFESRFAAATADNDLGFMTIREGHVAGIEGHWLGQAHGRVVFDVGFKWKMGQHIEQPWDIDHAYLLAIDGMPSLKLRLEIQPPKDFVANSLEDYMALGMVITGLPVVNAIAPLCAAAPGIRSYRDLPLLPARGFVAR